MQLDQILALINAGFTHEEITAILNQESPGPGGAPNPPGNPGPEPAPVPEPVPPAPVPVPVPDPAAPTPAPDMGGIQRAIETMGRNIISALQRASIGGTPAPPPLDPMKQMDLITAQIINPTYKKEDGNNG